MSELENVLKSLFGVDANGNIFFRAVRTPKTATSLNNATSTKNNRSLTTMFKTAIGMDTSGKPALRVALVDETETALLLGTLGFAAINAQAVAATTMDIVLATNQIPVGKQVVGLGMEVVTALASVSNPHVGLVIAQSEHFIVSQFEGDMSLADFTTGKKIVFNTLAGTKVTALENQTITLKFDEGGGEVNPKNFTAGSIKFYAILKDVPF